MPKSSATAAAVAVAFLATALTASAAEVSAARVASQLSMYHHVPPYPSHVTKVDIQNRPGPRTGGSYVLETTDSVAKVSSWYKTHLPDASGSQTTPDGAHLFYTHNGSTVDVERGMDERGAPITTIGVVLAR